MNIRNRVLIAVSAALGLSLFFTNCSGGFTAADVTSQNPWAQGAADTNTGDAGTITADPTLTPSCSVTPSSLTTTRDLPFGLNVTSTNISKIEMSVNGSAYSGLPVTSGYISWPGGTFDAGTYALEFRGYTKSNSYVTCDPAGHTVVMGSANTNSSGTSNNGGTTNGGTSGGTNSGSGSTTSSGTIDRNYAPLTGYTSNGSATDAAFKNFKSIYHPDNLNLVDVSADYAPGVKCYNLQIRHHSNSLRLVTANQKYRIFIPPGTKYFDMITLTYWDQTTKQALAVKIDSAPQSTYEDALNRANLPSDSVQLSRVLESIMGGQEYRAYVGESGNALPRISSGTTYGGATPYVYQTNRPAWLYVHQVKLIGDVAMNLEIRMCGSDHLQKLV